jgi:phosphodiesterase/alkaline phosphatase D-like protein
VPHAPAFELGVASGEVTRSSVRLWTHCTEDGPLHLSVRDGDHVVTETEVSEEPEQPHVFRAVVDGLDPDVRYDYVFSSERDEVAGSFRTLPPDGVPLRFAVMTCAKYNSGFFNAYRAVAERDDLHFVMHVGDYIYEAGNTPRGNQTPGADIGRPFQPPGECLTFEDYMTRYRQYRSDPDLQACHARHAFWQTLDDHELADNAWAGGAEDHHEDEDGPWADRVRGALRAWEYWTPTAVRPTRGDDVGRSFTVGHLAQVVILETRLHRDGPTVPAGMRSELGAAQRDRVAAALRDAATHWTVLACPSVVTSLHRPGLPTDVADALRTLKLMEPSGEDSPYHDLWGGFSGERDWLVGQLAESPSKVVVVSGDVHVGLDSDLVRDGRVAAREWTAPSISSQNLDDKLGWQRNVESAPIVAHLVESLPHVHWADLDSHGFTVVELTSDDASCEWYAVEAVLEPTDRVELLHRATWAG